MKRTRAKRVSIAAAILAALAWAIWQFGPFQAVFAIANLSDPEKLATLGERGANSRLNKIVYWLHFAQKKGLPPDMAVRLSQWLNWTREPRASLVEESLVRNLKIADGLGLLTEENKTRLRSGRAGVITRGPYGNSNSEVDHIVPFSLAPEAGNELANLELMPQELNRRKSNRVGERQVAHAERLFAAKLITRESLERVKARAGL